MSIMNPLYLDSLETLAIPSSQVAKQRRRQGASTTLIGDQKFNLISPGFIESFKSSNKENTQKEPTSTKRASEKRLISKKDLNRDRSKKQSKRKAELANLRAALASSEETSQNLQLRIIKFEKYIEKLVGKLTKTSDKKIKTRRGSRKSIDTILNRSKSLPNASKVFQHKIKEKQPYLETEMQNLFNRTSLLIKYLKKHK